MRRSATVAITHTANSATKAIAMPITNRGGEAAKRRRDFDAVSSPADSVPRSPVVARESDCDAGRTIPRRLPNEILQNACVHSDLRRFLLDAGASERDLERAEAEGWLPLLTLDRLVSPGPALYDAAG